jgi:uncharacterized phiE125 gp8 family phage protein
VITESAYYSINRDKRNDTYTGHSITKSKVLPVPFEDARRQLRLDDLAQDDEYVQMLVAALCDDIERVFEVAMITQTVVEKHFQFPTFANGPLSLLIRPGIAVTSITYIDSAGASQTFDSADYDVTTTNAGMFIIPKVSSEWPTDLAIRPDAVTITYTAGYGTTPTSVPGAMRLAVLNRLGKFDANREDAVSEKVTASDILLQPFYQFKA